MALNTRVDLAVGSVLTGSLDLDSTPKTALSKAYSIALSSGVGSGMADQLWFDKRTILASANDDLDLAGSLVNGLGATVTFARIKGICIYSLPANVNNLHIGGGSNPFINWVANSSDIVVVRPGGLMLLMAPDATAYAVTATTGDILRVTNAAAGSSVEYEIVLIGATA